MPRISMCSAIQPLSRAMFDAMRSAEALLPEQRVAAVARPVRPDLPRLREVDDVLVVVARPGHVLLARARAARRRCACTARRAARHDRSPRRRAVPMRAMIRMLTTTYGRVGQLDADLRHRRADEPMLNGSTYIVRPAIAPLNRSFSLRRISYGFTQLLVGPAASSESEQTNVRCSTRATSLASERA